MKHTMRAEQELRGFPEISGQRAKAGGSARSARPAWLRSLGKIVVFMSIVSFLFVGLWINLAQVFLVVALRFAGHNGALRRAIKRANAFLVYALFSPPIIIIYYWSRIKLNIQLEDLSLMEQSKKPLLAIVLPNHSFELDYVVCFVLADQLGDLGCYKSMSREDIRYLPVIGWALWMSDMIFVKRNWSRDKGHLGRKLDQFYDYRQSMLGIFAEGTRWTQEKHRASAEFAKARGLEPFSYHLIPRTRGFTYTVRHFLREKLAGDNGRLEDKLFVILNLEILLAGKPTFRQLLEGEQLEAHVFCEQVQISKEIEDEVRESRSEDDCHQLTELLMKVFRRKDELVHHFKMNNNTFPVDPKRGGPFPVQRKLFSLVSWALGFLFTYSILLYLALTRFAASPLFWASLVGFFGACALMLNKMEQMSQAKNSTLRARYKIPAGCDRLATNESCASNNGNRISGDNSDGKQQCSAAPDSGGGGGGGHSMSKKHGSTDSVAAVA